MPFSWDIKTEEEAKKPDEEVILSKGVYKFKVWSSEEGLSKAGNHFVLIKLNVEISPGVKVFSEDRITNHKNMFFKRKHFWDSVGKPENLNESYEAYRNQEGMAEFDVEEYDSEKYGKKMQKLVPKDYITLEKPTSEKDAPFPNEDVPF